MYKSVGALALGALLLSSYALAQTTTDVSAGIDEESAAALPAAGDKPPISADLEATKARLNEFFTQTQTIRGEFVQRVVDTEGQLVQESNGTVELLRPGRFRWEYLSPFSQLIVADGQYLWIYDKELEQATVRLIDKVFGNAPIMLLSETRAVDEDFIVEGAEVQGDLVWLTLRPIVEDTDFNRIMFGLDDTGLKRLVLNDQFGQRTIIKFENLIFNDKIPPSTFRFEVPPGVDVIGAVH